MAGPRIVVAYNWKKAGYGTPPVPTKGLSQAQREWLAQRFALPPNVAGALLFADIAPSASALSRLEHALARVGVPLADLLIPSGQGTYRLAASAKSRIADALEVGASRPANWTSGERVNEAIGAQRGASPEVMGGRYHAGWGATSPNTDFVRNTDESLEALAAWLRNEQFTVQNLRQRNVTQAGSKAPNLERAYTDRPLLASGHPGKADAMAGFMAGKDRIPIDVHALAGVGAREQDFASALPGLRAKMTQAEGLPARGGLNPGQIYSRTEDAFRTTLRDIVNGTYRPRAEFAQFWEGVRRAKGLPYYGGVIDLLERAGLLRPGAMADPAAIEAATRSGLIRQAAQAIKAMGR